MRKLPDIVATLPPELQQEIARAISSGTWSDPVCIESLCSRWPDHARMLRASLDPQKSDEGETVQSTATDELLQRLTEAPKLDLKRYRAEGEIAHGGMGSILKVYDSHLSRKLAMKVMLEPARQPDADDRKLARQLLGRFLEEAQITSQLDHPGVVPVHELGLDQDGRVFFLMRLVRGITIDVAFESARQEREGWTRTRALEAILRVCDTMAYAHAKGVLHRDLKPSNVMVGRHGEVYVMDWGLAKVLGHADPHDIRLRKEGKAKALSTVSSIRASDKFGDPESSVVTMDGQQLGTPSYMSPEQGRGEPLDVRADVYSIGAMLYELLAGRAPYAIPGQKRAAYRILEDLADAPPKPLHTIDARIPPELLAIVDRAMHRERNLRYVDVQHLAHDIRSFLEGRVVEAYRTGAMAEMRSWIRRNRSLAIAVLAAGSTALILVVSLLAGEASRNRQEADRMADRAQQSRLQAEDAVELARRAESSALVARENEAMAKQSEERAKQQEQLANERAAMIQKMLEDAKESQRRDRAYAASALLAEARRQEDQLYPPTPGRTIAIRDWLSTYGEALSAALPAIRDHLRELEARATPAVGSGETDVRSNSIMALEQCRSELRGEIDPIRRRLLIEDMEERECDLATQETTFESPRDRHLYRMLVLLVRQLEAFTNEGGLRDRARKLLKISETTFTRTVTRYQDEWEQVGRDLESDERFRGLHLKPQVGLVPLSMDPVTHLWEFLFVASAEDHEDIPSRDPTSGRLTCDGWSGLVFVLLPGGVLPEGGSTPPYLISKYEMTRGQWIRLAGGDTSIVAEADLPLPINRVDWFDCEKLLRRNGLRLPTEAEWEYGCRAGTTSKWNSGHNVNSLRGHENLHFGGRVDGIGSVGQLAGNAFGLHDMHGNVREWCLETDSRNIDGRRDVERGVSRGGSYVDDPEGAASNRRDWIPLLERTFELGLRPVHPIQSD